LAFEEGKGFWFLQFKLEGKEWNMFWPDRKTAKAVVSRLTKMHPSVDYSLTFEKHINIIR